jgi:hypothetical protein
MREIPAIRRTAMTCYLRPEREQASARGLQYGLAERAVTLGWAPSRVVHSRVRPDA